MLAQIIFEKPVKNLLSKIKSARKEVSKVIIYNLLNI